MSSVSIMHPRDAATRSECSAKEKMTTSSPVTVLMSWCILNTFTPATSWTSDSSIGRANSSSCFLTCLMRSLPFSGDNDLPSCRSARVKTPRMRTTKRSLMKMGVDLLRPPSQILLLKANDPITDCCFALCLGKGF